MTAYASLAPEIRLILAGIVFLASLGELALCLYRYICTETLRRCALPVALYLGLLVFLSVAVGSHPQDGMPVHPIYFPWLCFPLLAALVAAHSAVILRREYRQSQRQIGPNSVREAIDRLDSGICFADKSGRLILINRTMNRLGFTLIGGYPQTISEITRALGKPSDTSGVFRLDESAALYRFPDGRVWKFQTAAIDEPGLEGFTKMTAQDMTELYRVNEKLAQDNMAIREAIVKMRDMIARMSDLAREQETLNLKMQVHNDIGASLISLSELTSGENEKDAETQVATLKKALAYFSSRPYAPPNDRDELNAFAAECGVALTFDGKLPEDGRAKELIHAAVRECVTNCVRHAGGRNVNVKLTEHGGVCTAVITNDGDAPNGPIVEGGGLSSLRRKVEKAGGEMYITHTPRFILTVNLTEGSEPI